MSELATAVNCLAAFCGPRDIPRLDKSSLENKYGLEQVDVFVLFGGSIVAGGDVLAEAIRQQVARRYVIVGGAGHTTEALRQSMAQYRKRQLAEDSTEAELFAAYVKEEYGYEVDALETASTNCGNNISYLLDLMKDKGFDHDSMILCQDATMQLRMTATMCKYAPHIQVINFASHSTNVIGLEDRLNFESQPKGMWSMKRYLQLLMGEIPRLRDDAEGYGPRGKDFLAHVDLPSEVEQAFQLLLQSFPDSVRQVNPAYASP